MKLNKIVIIAFLIIFGYISASLRKEIILKSDIDISGINSSFINLILNIDFSIGFLYPIFFFTFFFIIFSISSFIIIEKKIKALDEIIMYSMLPNFIFTALNYNYAIEMTNTDLSTINTYKINALIPYLSFEISSMISSGLYILPSLLLFIFLLFRDKLNILNSSLISILPMLIIYLTSLFI